MREIKNILFVCTGNSCRSVMAEGLLKKHLCENKRSDIQVRSCGIAAISGFFPTPNTIQVMKSEGIDVSGYKTTNLTKDLVDKADLILTMDEIHKNEVIKLAPDAKDKVFLLKEFVKKNNEKEFSILDPIGKPLEVYERVFGIIKEAVEKLVEKI